MYLYRTSKQICGFFQKPITNSSHSCSQNQKLAFGVEVGMIVLRIMYLYMTQEQLFQFFPDTIRKLRARQKYEGPLDNMFSNKKPSLSFFFISEGQWERDVLHIIFVIIIGSVKSHKYQEENQSIVDEWMQVII